MFLITIIIIITFVMNSGFCRIIFVCNLMPNTAVRNIKGTHTVYFSSSLYIINQNPMIPRTHFHCKTT